MNRKLRNKIDAALLDAEALDPNATGNPDAYIYLTGEELIAMAKSSRIVWSQSIDLHRYTEVDGTQYYNSLGEFIRLSRKQRIKVAQGFAEWDKKNDQQLYARVYVSRWDDGKGKYWISPTT